MLIPDRLPSLIVLVGFWIPPAVAGLLAAWSFIRSLGRPAMIYAMLAIFVVLYAGAWFFFNLSRMPPYIRGALPDPTVATSQAFTNLVIFTAALILPGSAIACALAYRLGKSLLRTLNPSSNG